MVRERWSQGTASPKIASPTIEKVLAVSRYDKVYGNVKTLSLAICPNHITCQLAKHVLIEGIPCWH